MPDDAGPRDYAASLGSPPPESCIGCNSPAFFTNQLLIAAQRPDATQVAGYRKWEEMGRQVMKGEKGIAILAPRKVRVTVTDAAGNPVRDEKGKPKKELKVVGFTTATVFDVSQTDGDPLPELKDDLTAEPPAGYIEDLEKAITGRGFTVSYEADLPGSARGYSSPEGKVVVRESLSPAMRAKVLAHELGHIAAGHLDELEEYHTGHGGQRGRMEVEAESIAYTLCRANGMSTEVGDISGTYVAGWATAAEPDAVKAAAQKVSKTVATLLGEGDWTNAESI
ncbi:ArdC-like ssDNA-binding domain-containing protein [Pseudactinotalea terrae]|uniref:ArdC-like ssDNA-binding domain-containing protein n=1 Tax=Pseudactinotalea terrae TaxID=1743262 RepID=UPI0012E29B38|nr:ArdC-like ssDNA-binding domain-containing protein [Pseudactinotalea terrae]